MTQAGERGVMTEESPDVGAGWVLFAAVVMIVGGLFAFFEGLAALLKSGRFYHTAANYPYGGNVKTWGWIVLIAGVIVLLAGFYVMTGALWARIVGITLASLSALANFFFIPFYPFWSLMTSSSSGRWRPMEKRWWADSPATASPASRTETPIPGRGRNDSYEPFRVPATRLSGVRVGPEGRRVSDAQPWLPETCS